MRGWVIIYVLLYKNYSKEIKKIKERRNDYS